MFVPSLGASAITSDWNSAVTLVSTFTVSSQVVVVPEHAPPQPMNRVRPAGDAVRFAYTARSLRNVNVQPPGPLQPAPQPSKLKPLAGAASSEIEIPSAKSA